MAIEGFERPGELYLGSPYDLSTGEIDGTPLLYKAANVTTHAVCVGMTGSGKTGLCICLLEEAILQGIPALLIDPKGDLGNLLLTFPELEAEAFRPWIDPDRARRDGISEDEFAGRQAELWRNGLAQWGQDGERIRRLREAAEFRIYTPGSSAGLPVSILASFAAPPEEVREEEDLLRDRVGATATGLLSLLGLAADPVQSREHILLSTLFDETWRAGRDLDLEGLIHGVQRPPFDRVGVMGLETFYPASDRFKLATQLNSLLAAPGFRAWLTGTPLEVGRLLRTAEGKPRVVVFSIAHLSEAEQMFFVTLLLNQALSWMRTQPGTESLRALLYMDEIFGFLPPVAEPPSKRPFLTLLKQGRAYGLGTVLATQNPVDLDYKALSNAGTWFLGRLQTERDQRRVLDGLAGVTAGAERFDRRAMEKTLAGLRQRVFVLHSAHADEPVVFHSRWAMSYLSGPLTRPQIERLMAPYKEGTSDGPAAAEPVSADSAAAPSTTEVVSADPSAPSPAETSPLAAPPGAAAARPVLPPDVQQFFLPGGADGARAYEPGVLALARLYFADRSRKHEGNREVALFTAIVDGPVPINWNDAHELQIVEDDLQDEPRAALPFSPLPAAATRTASYREWRAALETWLYHNRSLELLQCKELGLTSEADESDEAFRRRLEEAAQVERARREAALEEKRSRDVERLDDRIRRAEAQLAKRQEQVAHERRNTLIHLGTALAGRFLGGRRTAGVGSAARSYSRVGAQKQDLQRAQGDLEALQQEREERQEQHEEALKQLGEQIESIPDRLETISIKPRKADIRIRLLALAWRPA